MLHPAVALCVLALLALCQLSLVSAHASKPKIHTVVLKEIVTLRTNINAFKTNKTSGDRSLWTASMQLPSSPGQIGLMTGECVYVDGVKRIQQCAGSIVFGNDSLMFGGPYCSLGSCFHGSRDSWGLLGGTGLYRSASGELRSQSLGNDTYVNTLTIAK